MCPLAKGETCPNCSDDVQLSSKSDLPHMQYACGDYQRALNSHGMIYSISRKGDCWDNAPMESWFHTLKTELVNHRDYRSRRHSGLGYMTPAQYEMIKMAA